MIRIDDQAQIWGSAYCPKIPRIGSLVAIRFGADGPGLDDFRRMIRREGLDYVWVRAGIRRQAPGSKWDVYKITRGEQAV